MTDAEVIPGETLQGLRGAWISHSGQRSEAALAEGACKTVIGRRLEQNRCRAVQSMTQRINTKDPDYVSVHAAGVSTGKRR